MLGYEESELARGVRAFLRKEFDSVALHAFIDSGALRQGALQRQAQELGLLSLALPERQGGLELDATGMAPIYGVLGAFMPPLPVVSMAIAADVLAMTRSDPWLERIAAGASAAIVLPPYGASPNIEQTRDGFAVSGEIAFLLDGADALFFILKGRTSTGGAWFACPSDASGATITRVSLVDETRSAAHIVLEDVRLSADNVLAFGAEAEHLDQRILVHAALAFAADSIGGAAAMLDKTLEYMRVREQFSRPIGSFQALKHRAANLHLSLATNQALLQEALSATDEQRGDAQDLAALACAHATDMYAALAEDSLQLHGGIGFTRAHDAHVHLKRAKLNQALLGGSAVLRDRAARLAG